MSGPVFAARETTVLRNAGPAPCTRLVIHFHTPLTPEILILFLVGEVLYPDSKPVGA